MVPQKVSLTAIEVLGKEILSPRIFVLAMEVLSIHLELEIETENTQPIKKAQCDYVPHYYLQMIF